MFLRRSTLSLTSDRSSPLQISDRVSRGYITLSMYPRPAATYLFMKMTEKAPPEMLLGWFKRVLTSDDTDSREIPFIQSHREDRWKTRKT
jgi:hypothetical protein